MARLKTLILLLTTSALAGCSGSRVSAPNPPAPAPAPRPVYSAPPPTQPATTSPDAPDMGPPQNVRDLFRPPAHEPDPAPESGCEGGT